MSDEHQALAAARVGRVLDGKWRLERLLGVGGMAAVYEGLHRNASRGAVKILHPELAADPEVRERFLREGYAANRVEHPSVVRVIDDDVVREGLDAGAAFLVMELLDGESLFGRMKRLGHALRDEDVLAVAEPVLDVLAAAHAHGVIHRDLKPDNVFLVGPRELGVEQLAVKVLDFGIARVSEAAGRTRAGTMLGTLSYMPPEQARGAADLDGRADLYALGATMFRALTGRRVHDAQGNELLTRVATTPAPPIRGVHAGVGEALAAIVDRALRFQRADRYADAVEMRDDVRAARAGLPLPSRAQARSLRGDDAPTRADRVALPAQEEPTRPVGPEPPTTPVAKASPALAPSRAERTPQVPIVAARPLAPVPTPIVLAAPLAARAAKSPSRRRWLVGLVAALGAIGAAGVVVALLLTRSAEPATRQAAPAPTVEIEDPTDEPTSALAGARSAQASAPSKQPSTTPTKPTPTTGKPLAPAPRSSMPGVTWPIAATLSSAARAPLGKTLPKLTGSP